VSGNNTVRKRDNATAKQDAARVPAGTKHKSALATVRQVTAWIEASADGQNHTRAGHGAIRAVAVAAAAADGSNAVIVPPK
jgi:hypothetical protein